MYRNFTADSDFVVIPFTPRKSDTPARRQPWFFGHNDDLLVLLERASDLLRTGFTQGHLATNRHGMVTDPLNSDAAKFCALGAIKRINNELPGPRFLGRSYRRQRYNEAVRIIYNEIRWHPGLVIDPYSKSDPKLCAKAVMYWNDESDQSIVISGFTRAVRNERTKCLLRI